MRSFLRPLILNGFPALRNLEYRPNHVSAETAMSDFYLCIEGVTRKSMIVFELSLMLHLGMNPSSAMSKLYFDVDKPGSLQKSLRCSIVGPGP